MCVRFRIDDFPKGEPGNSLPLSKIEQLLEPFELRGIPYYLGIVPFAISPEEWAFLGKLHAAIFAFHGFTHGFDNWRPSDAQGGEFRDRNVSSLLDTLHLAVQLIDHFLGITVDVFIPPFNVFTQQLLDALNHAAFSVITGGPETYKHEMHLLDFGDLDFRPSVRLPFYGRADEITSALRREHVTSTSPICLHLTWENTNADIYALLDKFASFSTNCRKFFVSL